MGAGHWHSTAIPSYYYPVKIRFLELMRWLWNYRKQCRVELSGTDEMALEFTGKQADLDQN
jgi:hypothetical protein